MRCVGLAPGCGGLSPRPLETGIHPSLKCRPNRFRTTFLNPLIYLAFRSLTMHLVFWVLAFLFFLLSGAIGVLVAIGYLPPKFGVIALPLCIVGTLSAAWLADMSERRL